MKDKKYVLVALLLISSAVFAGDRGGNGSEDVKCPSGGIILDDFRWKARSFNLPLEGEELNEKVSFAIEQIARVDPYRAEIMKFYSTEIMKDIDRHESGINEFKNITSDITLSQKCEEEEHKIIQQELLLDRLNVDQKALLVLRESWYQYLISEGAAD